MKQEIEMLDALFKHATEGIIVTGKDARIVMVNPKAERLFGYEKDELIGNTIEVLIPSRYAASHVGHRNGYMKNPHPRAMGIGLDLFARKKDGSEFPVEVSLSNFSTSEGQYFMSFIIDITERKKQEEEIKTLNTELERRVDERTEELAQAVNKLAESRQEVIRALEKEKELNEMKSRFISTASHEFRTPLATILSSIYLISDYKKEEDENKRAKHVEKIISSVGNLTQILNDFLSLSKLEEGIIQNQPEQFDLDIFTHGLIEEITGTLKKGQKITYNHKGQNSVVLDKQLLKNILINLFSNAIKYSPEDKEISMLSHLENKNVTIEIKDSGIGIPEEDQLLLFERFFRAHNATNIQGTGLGLNIVKKYIELMNGEISFSSKLDEGTTFKIILPQ